MQRPIKVPQNWIRAFSADRSGQLDASATIFSWFKEDTNQWAVVRLIAPLKPSFKLGLWTCMQLIVGLDFRAFWGLKVKGRNGIKVRLIATSKTGRMTLKKSISRKQKKCHHQKSISVCISFFSHQFWMAAYLSHDIFSQLKICSNSKKTVYYNWENVSRISRILCETGWHSR